MYMFCFWPRLLCGISWGFKEVRRLGSGVYSEALLLWYLPSPTACAISAIFLVIRFGQPPGAPHLHLRFRFAFSYSVKPEDAGAATNLLQEIKFVDNGPWSVVPDLHCPAFPHMCAHVCVHFALADPPRKGSQRKPLKSFKLPKE